MRLGNLYAHLLTVKKSAKGDSFKAAFLSAGILLFSLPSFAQTTTFNYTGSIVAYTVPTGVTSVQITAKGAQGGSGASGTGGLGAIMVGNFTVTPGHVLNILVAGQGNSAGGLAASGGGGTFVWDVTAGNTLLIAAGGGGGGASCGTSGASNASSTTTPVAGGSAGSGAGGAGGNGGAGGGGPNGIPTFPSTGGGGCGWLSNGGNGTFGTYIGGGGFSPLNGGAGGTSGGGGGGGAIGGFGGGGGSAGNCGASGGGGGYNGGGGGNIWSPSSQWGLGGGGGSYNGGTSQANSVGNSGNGQVLITNLYTPQAFNNGSSQGLAVCENSGVTSLNSLLTTTGSSGYTDTWTVTSGPSNGTLGGFPATASSGTNISPSGTTYTPSGSYTGTDAFTIQVSDGTSTATTTITVTVNAVPNVSNFSTSATNVCQGTGSVVTITSSSLAAGTYNVTYNLTGANSATGTIGSVTMSGGTGTFTTSSLANSGSTTIQITGMTNTNGCSSTVISGGITAITVNGNPGSIFVPSMVCVGSTISLTDGVIGGTWSSSNTGIATVGSASGTVTGISGGTPNITYTLSSGCYATTLISVNPTPNGITGSSAVCTGYTTSLTETSSGGSWTSSNSGVASVGSTGVVTGVAAGTVTISYTFATGPCAATFPMTVNATPAANTGLTSVCTGLTITLANGIGGGTWSSTNTGVATVGSASGVVTGVSAGTPTISYTLSTGCFANTNITVNTNPSSISGANNVCVGSSTTLTNSVGGGVWSSSNNLLATVGSGSGIVNGVAVGNPYISYTIASSGCYSVQAMTVNPNPTSITGTTFFVCTGSSITLGDGTTGGTWSSSNTALASVGSGTGVVSGVAFGTPTISYIMGTSCYATQQVTVNTTPNPITGSNTVCLGGTTNLTSSTGGGSWSSANPAIASVGSGTGIVTGVATGNTTITYLMPSGCFVITTMTVNPNPIAISGTFTVCTGASQTLTDATSGGTWSSSNGGLATVGAGTGTVTGVAAGNPVISYTIGTGCYATRVITVIPTPAAIGGPQSVCVGSTITITDATFGGSWTSSSTGLATVGSGTGTVAGIAVGVPTMTYTATNGCIATQPITVNAAPASIVGSSTVCTGFSTVLTDATSGGLWSTSDATKATIGAGTGTVTGVAAGTPTITYTMPSGCTATLPMTVNQSPVAIAGTPNVCIGFTTILSDGIGGGTFSSSNTSLATVVGGTGVVTGVSSGVPTISYTITSTGCYATTPVTVNPNPAAIGGSPVLCVGSTTTLTDATLGGTWSSNDVTRATVGASSGLVTGVSSGNPNISYTLPTGCYSFVTSTINALPVSITGITNVCIGFTTTLADATSGGTWSSSNTSIATVAAGTGVVTGVAAGVTTITYTLTATGCYITTSVTVNPNPPSITGTTNVCVGATTPLFDVSGGGLWTSSNTGLATVGGGSGVVSGVSAGNPVITYTLPTGCSTTANITVNPLPAAITGTMNVCVGLTTALSDATSSGSWSSSNTSEATVVAGTGVVTGVAAGTPTISYTLTATGCYATTPVTVNANPSTLTGTASVCTGFTTTLASTPSGGTWTSSNTALATVGASTGVVSGISVGNPVITYTLSTGCINTQIVTVNQTPVAIAGTATVCVGTTTNLTDATAGGSWSSSNTSQATIGTGSGIATGLAAGIPIISYTMSTGCYNTIPITVNPLPANISGSSTVCTGFTDGLSDATPGGTWTSSNISWATVNAGTGVVTGVATGAPVITYTLPTGCIASFVVTVNQTPGAVSGTMSVCTGSTTTLADGTPGGTWTSSNTSEATVVAGTGVVTGIAAGTPTISYTMGSGCYATANVTVNTTPAAISGPSSVCTGSNITLSDVTAGGSWTSSNTGVATIGAASGIVTGISAGAWICTYTTPSGCFVTVAETVNPTPAGITGTTTVCAGSTTTLSDGTSGGTWSSGNTSIATVGTSSGTVTGVASGVANISYTLSAGCFATSSYTVNAVPNISNFTSTTATSPCSGSTSTVTISSTSLGAGTFTVTYNLTGANSATGATATLTMGATNGTFTIPSALLPNSGSTTVTVTGISNGFSCLSSPASNNTSSFVVNGLPTAYNVIGGGAYCSGGSGVHIFLSNSVGGVNYQLWLGATAVGTPLAGTFAGLDFGLITTAGTYTVTATNATTGCTSNMSGSATVSINSLPGTFAVTGGGSYCSGGTGVTVGLFGSATGINYQLYAGGVATGTAVGGTGSAISFGLQTAGGTYTVVGTDATTGCTNTMTGSATVVVNPLPAAISGTLFLCPGTATTLSDATGGGSWSSSTPAVATVGSSTGVVTGVTTGVSVITYTLATTGCTNTATVTVNPNPASIAGLTGVCVGGAITLTDATGGGTWSSSNTALATINVTTGIVSGIATGTPTMTYTLSTGCIATYAITVNPTPVSIAGTFNVCNGLTTTLTDASSGGTWSSSNSLVASIGSSTGTVTGSSAGTATITYTLPAGCTATAPFTVNPAPASVAGATSVCNGSATTLTDASSGGTWTSSNTGIATVGAVSGTVTGVSAGVVTITYTLPAGCNTTYSFTVNPVPASITGISNICAGLSTTLNDATGGGTWSSSNTGVATVGSASGVVTGVTAGAVTVTYTLPAGCTSLFNMTVNANPATISGVMSVCVGLTTSLSDGTPGGSWTSSNTGLATVSSSGVVTGVATGTPTITYTLSTGCIATTAVTVNPNPPSITGVATVCTGLTTTLSDATTGGTWTSANPSIASIGSSSGVVTGVASGTVSVTYTLPTGCINTTTVTVNPSPVSVAGAAFVCVGQTATLTDASSGGSWSSSNTSLATVGTGTGVVTGVAVGVPYITYTLPAGCFTTYSISVNPVPASITGTTNVCSGLTTTLSDATAGGTWSSSNTGIATVGSATGVVTGVTSGSVNITYLLPGGCYVTTAFTVNPTPVSISGSSNVCLGLTTALTDASSGGAWSSSNTAVGSIGTTGIVTGVSVGTTTITYTLPAGCFNTLPFTVNPLPANISGTLSVCQSLTTTLTDASSGGVWTSSNTLIATVTSSTGVVTGVSTGTATITYTLPTTCITTSTVTVNALPTVYTVTGGGAYCAGGTGASVGLSGSQSGVNYQLFIGGVSSGFPVFGTGSAISFGLQTTAGTYTVVATNATTGCVSNMTGSATVTINNLPIVYNMTGGGGYCSGGTGVSVGLGNSQTGINYQLYNGSVAVGSPVAGTSGSAINFGLMTGAGSYTVIATNAVTGCSATMAGASVVTINSLPTAFAVTGGGGYCSGGTGVTIGLSGSATGVSYTVTNGSVSATLSGSGSALNFGLFTAAGTYTVNATNSITSCTNSMTGSATVSVNALPTNTFVVTGGGAYCAGGTGVTVGLSGSQSGVNYQLYVGGVSTGITVAGGGSSISFGLQTTGGTYSVVAVNTTTGCTSTMTTTVSVLVNSLPPVFSVTGGGSYCVGGTGVTIGLSGSTSGYLYTVYRVGGTSVGSTSGTGSSFTFPLTLSTAGTYTVTATNTTTGCVSAMSGSAVVGVNPLPTLYSVTGGGSYCAGSTGLHVGLTNSDLGINYQLMLAGATVGLPVAGTGSALDFGVLTAPGIYTVVATNPLTGCNATMSSSALIVVNPLPSAFTVTGGGSYCAGSAGVHIGLSGSTVGFSYQLLLAGTPVGIPILGTGTTIDFGFVTAAGTYTAMATNISTGCTGTMTGLTVVNINAAPTVYALTGGGSYCAGGAGVAIGLSGSDAGISYQLYNGTFISGTPVAGTGSTISFGVHTDAGAHSVVATNTLTGCTSNMSGGATIVVNPLPAVYAVTGGGTYCTGGAGVPVGLSTSDTGISYQLMLGGTAMGAPVAGTGAAISFGLQTGAGSYTIVATNNITGCINNMSGSVLIVISPLPAVYTVTGGGSYCPGGSGVVIGLSGSATGVNYQLSLSGAPLGPIVAGTGAVISFGTQTGLGIYSVIATDGTTGCTSTMTGTAVVSLSALPTVFNMTGGGGYCAGGTGSLVGLSGSATGVNYQLYLGTAAVGIPNPGTGAALSFGLRTLTGIYTVVATSTVTGCSATMAGSDTVSLNPLPTPFTVTGGGGYCAGGTGVLVGLSGSGVSVSYQLFVGGVPVGSPLAGTGGAISYGLITVPGTYTVVATNSITGCINNMTGSATVMINPLPIVYSVTGGGSYCAGGAGVHVLLSTSDLGINYQLYNGASTVGSTVAGTGSPLDFGALTTAGFYTVTAVDPLTGCTGNMGGSATVAINPLPALYTVTGGGSYCAGGTGVVVGLSGSAMGINYQLLNGGVPSGSAVAGTGSALSFGLQTIGGTYTVVATNAATGCVMNMGGSAAVVVNPLPFVDSVTGGGSYCPGGTGVHVGLNTSAVGVNYQLMRGTTVLGLPVAGTGSGLDFGLQSIVGTYFVTAANPATGCTSNMTGSASVSISPLPTVYTLATSSSGYCAGGTGVSVTLSGSSIGTQYQLYIGTLALGSPLSGTGFLLNFGLETSPGSYSVVATSTATGCLDTMSGRPAIVVNPLPGVYTVSGGGSICAGGAGVSVLLGGSDLGVSYQLMNGPVAVGSPVAGTGYSLNFGPQSVAGVYTVIATNTATGCTNSMLSSATVNVNASPIAYFVTGGGSFCAGGTGVHVGVNNSDMGINYQLYDGSTAVGLPLAGTALALDFGAQTLPGSYKVVAINAGTGCADTMTGAAIVAVNAVPAAYAVVGGGNVCAGGSGVHVGISSSASSGVTYQLFNGGPVSPAISGTGSAIDFGLQTVAGTYTVVATNLATGCTANMAGSALVTVTSLPLVFTVTGGGSYCAGTPGATVGISSSESGVNYQLYNGSSTVGGLVGGTGIALSFGLEPAGVYTVVGINAATGCTNHMAGSATVTVIPSVTPGVTITTGVGDTVCAGTSVTFTALATNGGGAPTYQWAVNGIASGTGSSFSYMPANGNVVSVILTSNATCVSPATASNALTMTVKANVTPSVSITSSPGDTICQGTVVTFNAYPVWGGSAPLFTWYVGGTAVGASSVFTYAPADGDVVFCKMNSNYACVSTTTPVLSNEIAFVVDDNTTPVVNVSVNSGANIGSIVNNDTLTATVTHGGRNPSFQWSINGTPIPGAILPVFIANSLKNGDIISCAVTKTNSCGSLIGTGMSVIMSNNVGVQPLTATVSDVKLVPNPNRGIFSLKGSLGTITDEQVSVEITDMIGQVIYTTKVTAYNGILDETIQLNNKLANGMYILNLRTTGGENKVFHMVIEE